MTKVNKFAGSVTKALVGLTSVSAVLDHAKSVARRSASLDVDIHAGMVAAADMSVKHGDTSAAIAMLSSLGKAMRAKTAAQWFEEMTNIRPELNKGVWTAKLCDKKDRITVDLDKLIAKPFWDAQEKVQPGVFNDTQFAALVASIIKKAKDGANLSPEGKAALDDLKVLNVKLAPAE